MTAISSPAAVGTTTSRTIFLNLRSEVLAKARIEAEPLGGRSPSSDPALQQCGRGATISRIRARFDPTATARSTQACASSVTAPRAGYLVTFGTNLVWGHRHRRAGQPDA